MEQLFLLLIVLGVASLIFFSALFLYKRNKKISFIPLISTTIIAALLLIFAQNADGWDGLAYVLFGVLIATSTIIAAIALLTYHLVKKSQND